MLINYFLISKLHFNNKPWRNLILIMETDFGYAELCRLLFLLKSFHFTRNSREIYFSNSKKIIRRKALRNFCARLFRRRAEYLKSSEPESIWEMDVGSVDGKCNQIIEKIVKVFQEKFKMSIRKFTQDR